MDARHALALTGRDQDGLATRAQLVAAGLSPKLLSKAVAQQELFRVRRRVYAAAPLAAIPCQLLSGGRPDADYLRHVRAALLSLPPTARVSRRTAAVVWGFDLAVEPDRIEVDALTEVAPSRGIDVRRRSACRTGGFSRDGIRLPTPLSTVVDCVLGRPLEEGVTVADSALRSRLVSVDDLRRSVAARRGSPGHSCLARAVRLVDPRCESVLESLLRVLLARHGLCPPRPQFEIRRGGVFVARVDFCWPRQRLVVEADGRRWHDPQDARDRDRRRSNELQVLGWAVLRFTWAEVLHQPDYVVAAVRAALTHRAAS